MYSMTGYGKGEFRKDGLELVVEIKTVNNRFLDIIPKYPRSFISFDDLIRKTVQSKLNRGRVELFISVVDSRDKNFDLQVDYALASAYVNTAKQLSKKFKGVKNDFTVTQLIRVPELVKTSFAEVDVSELKDVLVDTLNSALDNLNSMRLVEGEKLKQDLLAMVSNIEQIVSEIKLIAPQVAKDHQDKMLERIKELLGEAEIDEARILQETAIFADKSNIDEEIERLTSHISQFRSICEDEGAGRKLDFLIQEFNRESNTICSKANNIKVTDCGLKLKCEIEKIREQVQNIE
ncbi:MAG: YicC family protein [Clostridia bacterium]|nr:YicC family protein [Clostridia bacterium]